MDPPEIYQQFLDARFDMMGSRLQYMELKQRFISLGRMVSGRDPFDATMARVLISDDYKEDVIKHITEKIKDDRMRVSRRMKRLMERDLETAIETMLDRALDYLDRDEQYCKDIDLTSAQLQRLENDVKYILRFHVTG